jgi:hypothetical protein
MRYEFFDMMRDGLLLCGAVALFSPDAAAVAVLALATAWWIFGAGEGED